MSKRHGFGSRRRSRLWRLPFAGILTEGLTRPHRNRVTDLERFNEQAIHAFVEAVDAKSPFTARHSERVADYAVLLARRLDLDPSHSEHIFWAALLHDVGKIALPDEILNKSGPLTPREWALVRRHPLDSVRILEGVDELAPLLPAIRHHHERMDGKGYPDGVRGEDLTLEARILAVVDAFEAMTNERPYRRAMTQREAVAELQRGTGTQFDPDLVELFVVALGPAASLEQLPPPIPQRIEKAG